MGSLSDGFFEVQQGQGTADVVAVQFARVVGVVTAAASPARPTTAEAAAQAIHANPGVVVIDESESRLGGLTGFNVTVENRSDSASSIFDLGAGQLSIDPKRRLWISLFDTTDGILAVMVGGSVADWEHALSVAEPVLESVVIGG